MKSKPPTTPGRAALIVARAMAIYLALAWAGTNAARAASGTWGGATDANWATLGNWSASPVPGLGDTATFGSANGGHSTISLGGGVTVTNITFNSVASPYTIGAGAVNSETLTVATGGAILVTNTSPQVNHLFNSAVVLGVNAGATTYQFYNAKAGTTLTFAGNITGGVGGTAGAKTLTIQGDGTTAISGNLGGGGGTMAVTVGGVGATSATFSGANSFTGALTVTGATLSIPTFNNASTAGPLGNSATAVTLSNGGILEYTGVTASSTKAVAISASGVGKIQVDSAATELTLSSAISGTGATLYVKGAGTLKLTAANTYSGETYIDGGNVKLSGSGRLGAAGGVFLYMAGGTLDLGGTSQVVTGLGNFGTIFNNGGGASTLTVDTTAGNPFGGFILDNNNSTAGTVALTKSGAGTLSLTGTTSYSGATTVSGGVLSISGAATLGNTTGATTVSSGATLSLLVGVGAEAITISGAGASGQFGALQGYDVDYSGLLKLGASATVAGLNISGIALSNPGTITGSGFTLTLGGLQGGSVASIIGTGTGGVIVDNSTWTMTGANTFSGALSVSGGKLIVPTVNNASTAGPLGNSATAVTLTNGNLEYTGASATSTKRFTLSASGTFTIDSASTELTLTGILAGTGAQLDKTGPGTLTLSGANTRTGRIDVYGGTLKVTGTTSLGTSASPIYIDPGATLDLGGTSQSAAQVVSGGTILNNGGGVSTLTLGAGPSDIGGSIIDNSNATAGTVAITKISTGDATVSGTNSYSGPTTISAGAFVAASDTALGNTTGATTVASGASLDLSGPVNIAGEQITIAGAGASGFTGALYSGSDGNVYGGLLKLSAAATIASENGAFSITNPGTITGAGFALTLTGVGTGSLASIIGTGAGTLTKTGTGAWMLSGANTYTGLTTISAGILNIQNANALGGTTTGTTITTGATLQIQGGIAVSAEPLTIRGAGASGATGALENVSGTNSFAGLITLGAPSTISSDAGTLNLTNTGTITGAALGLTLAGAGNGSLASIIGTTTGPLIKNGAGTWTLTGPNTYSGATTINAGILKIQNAAALGTTAGGVSVISGGTLQIDGGIAVGAEPIMVRGPGASGATGALENVSGANSYAGLVTLGADATISSDAGTLSLTNSGTITGGTFNLTLAGAGNGSLAGIIGTTSGGVTKTGSGAWTLSGANTFTGTLAVKNGTLAVPTFNNASASGPLGNSANAIVLGDTGTFGVLEYTGTSASSNKPVSVTGAGGRVQIDDVGAELTLSGGLSGSVVFTKLGPGTLTLASANSFAGYFEVNAGTVKVAAPGALAQALRVYLNSTLQLAGTGDRIGDTTEVALLEGGLLSMAGLSNQSETLGFLTVNSFFTPRIDFGSGTGDSLLFSGVTTYSDPLYILNWSGTPGVLGTASSDRLIFSGVPSDFTSQFPANQVSFNGTPGYLALTIDATHYEIVAAPEPTAGGLMLAGALLPLCRRRRRASGRASHS